MMQEIFKKLFGSSESEIKQPETKPQSPDTQTVPETNLEGLQTSQIDKENTSTMLYLCMPKPLSPKVI